MVKLIDDTLSSGHFEKLDDLYVKIVNATCRHLCHSGPNGKPSKKDRCATVKKIIDKDAMKKSGTTKVIKKRLYSANAASLKKQELKQIFSKIFTTTKSLSLVLTAMIHGLMEVIISLFFTTCIT